MIGTGGKGRIYRVTGEPSQTVLLTRAPAQQVTMFLQGADGQNYYATANPGKIFKLSSDRVEDGYYESDVLGRPDGRGLGDDSMAGVYPGWNRDPTVHALREHLDAQRYLEPLVGRLHQPERRADYEP